MELVPALVELLAYFEDGLALLWGEVGRERASEGNPGAEDDPEEEGGGGGDEAEGARGGVEDLGGGGAVPEGGAAAAIEHPGHGRLEHGKEKHEGEAEAVAGEEDEGGALQGGGEGEGISEVVGDAHAEEPLAGGGAPAAEEEGFEGNPKGGRAEQEDGVAEDEIPEAEPAGGEAEGPDEGKPEHLVEGAGDPAQPGALAAGGDFSGGGVVGGVGGVGGAGRAPLLWRGQGRGFLGRAGHPRAEGLDGFQGGPVLHAFDPAGVGGTDGLVLQEFAEFKRGEGAAPGAILEDVNFHEGRRGGRGASRKRFLGWNGREGRREGLRW